MPFDFIEGFDRYASTGSLGFQGRWLAALNSNNTAQLFTGRFGARCLRLRSLVGGGFIERLAKPSTRYGMQVAFKANHSAMKTVPYRIARWKAAGGAVQAAWGIDEMGRISVYNAANVAVFTSDGFEIANDGWTYIEMWVKHSATLGEVRLKINGETIYYGTNLNTGSLPIERIQFTYGDDDTIAGENTYFLDDMVTVYDEDDTPGESAALVFRPSADVSVDFTRLSGDTNADMVDEEQVDAEVTYNYSNTVGHTDIFELSDLTTTPEEIKAIFISIAARKEDSGTRQLEYFLVIDGTEYSLDIAYLGGSYEFYEVVVELNPATGLAWLPAEVNALRIGYRILE